MGAVCRSWSSAASNCSKQLTRTRNSSQELESVPKILIPWVIESHSSPYSTKVMCSMYNPSENKIYNNLNRYMGPSIITSSSSSNSDSGDNVDNRWSDYFCPGSRDVNCRIYSPSDKRMYKFAPFPAPPPDDHKHMLRKHLCIKHYRGIQCLGSVDEWLMVEDRTWHRPCQASGGESAKVRLYLFNPMTGEHVMLPSQSADIHVISTFISPKDSFLEKIVASSVPDTDPNNNNNSCIVAAIPAGGKALLFGRPTDEKCTCQRWYHRKCGDLLFHDDGKLYAMVQEDISYLVVFDPQEVLSSKNEYRGKTLFVRVPHDIPGEMEDARASLFRSAKGDIMLFWRSEVEDIYI
ncbi:hypothetical protein C1H46_014570 [Malus baccata]|uniref:KIB1-4 beta-propeller domain-containing protein n=1 Tax=Malus baccata TaxID=106549 RepID=A0A540MNM5_MALBA|nr:hypothetical protein C1H46_014570 [Malus baccata]